MVTSLCFCLRKQKSLSPYGTRVKVTVSSPTNSMVRVGNLLMHTNDINIRLH
jgi:hypothetical protein